MMGVRQGFEFIQGSLTVYTCVKCPIVGQKFCVNAPSKAPLRPEGVVVGEYIDRCIIQKPTSAMLHNIANTATYDHGRYW